MITFFIIVIYLMFLFISISVLVTLIALLVKGCKCDYNNKKILVEFTIGPVTTKDEGGLHTKGGN